MRTIKFFAVLAIVCPSPSPQPSSPPAPQTIPRVTPAYYGNKTHWNGLSTCGELPDSFIKEQLINSYRLVVKGISPKSIRQEVMAEIEKNREKLSLHIKEAL